MPRFFQVPLKKSDQENGSSGHKRHVCFQVMPMGNKNSPAFFQALMDKLLGSFKYAFSFAYQDDIIIYSKTLEEHKIHLYEVFDRLKHANLTVKLSKSQFMLDSVEYLGFLVSSKE
jgi:hypothetical protein